MKKTDGQLELLGYCKTKQKLKELTRIKNRGLARVMWGQTLNEIGANVPKSINKLIYNSSALARLPYSSSKLYEQQDEITAEIENRATSIDERTGIHAEAKGFEKVRTGLYYRLKEIAKKPREI